MFQINMPLVRHPDVRSLDPNKYSAEFQIASLANADYGDYVIVCWREKLGPPSKRRFLFKHGIFPGNWVQSVESYTSIYFPPANLSQQATKRAITNKVPVEATWKGYEAVMIYATGDQQAMVSTYGLLDPYMETTTVNINDSDVLSSTCKRRRKQRDDDESSTALDTGDETHKKAMRVRREKLKKVATSKGNKQKKTANVIFTAPMSEPKPLALGATMMNSNSPEVVESSNSLGFASSQVTTALPLGTVEQVPPQYNPQYPVNYIPQSTQNYYLQPPQNYFSPQAAPQSQYVSSVDCNSQTFSDTSTNYPIQPHANHMQQSHTPFRPMPQMGSNGFLSNDTNTQMVTPPRFHNMISSGSQVSQESSFSGTQTNPPQYPQDSSNITTPTSAIGFTVSQPLSCAGTPTNPPQYHQDMSKISTPTSAIGFAVPQPISCAGTPTNPPPYRQFQHPSNSTSVKFPSNSLTPMISTEKPSPIPEKSLSVAQEKHSSKSRKELIPDTMSNDGDDDDDEDGSDSDNDADAEQLEISESESEIESPIKISYPIQSTGPSSPIPSTSTGASNIVANAPSGQVTLPQPIDSNFVQVLGDSVASLLRHRTLNDSTQEKLVDHTRISKQLHLHTQAQIASLISTCGWLVQGMRLMAESMNVALPPLEVAPEPVPAPDLIEEEPEERLKVICCSTMEEFQDQETYYRLNPGPVDNWIAHHGMEKATYSRELVPGKMQNWSHMLRQVMDHLMTTELQTKFNWGGNIGPLALVKKDRFQGTRHSEIIMAVVALRTQQVDPDTANSKAVQCDQMQKCINRSAGRLRRENQSIEKNKKQGSQEWKIAQSQKESERLVKRTAKRKRSSTSSL